MKFRDTVKVSDGIRFQKGRRGGAPTVKLGESNVTLKLIDKDGRVVKTRRSHNIFLNYGREWISELVGLDNSYVPFRSDRLRYMAFGIGGTSQSTASATLRSTWAGFPNDWDYTDPDDLSTGSYGGSGSGDPSQTDTDPTVTGLEYPVQVDDEVYYDNLMAPATFPEVGIIRLTSVLGYNQVSFGAVSSVPLSEIGLFTESVPSLDTPPLDASIEVTPPVPAKPAVGTRYMVAYNSFDVLHKTSDFVLQIDWELRFA